MAILPSWWVPLIQLKIKEKNRFYFYWIGRLYRLDFFSFLLGMLSKDLMSQFLFLFLLHVCFSNDPTRDPFISVNVVLKSILHFDSFFLFDCIYIFWIDFESILLLFNWQMVSIRLFCSFFRNAIYGSNEVIFFSVFFYQWAKEGQVYSIQIDCTFWLNFFILL